VYGVEEIYVRLSDYVSWIDATIQPSGGTRTPRAPPDFRQRARANT